MATWKELISSQRSRDRNQKDRWKATAWIVNMDGSLRMDSEIRSGVVPGEVPGVRVEGWRVCFYTDGSDSGER